MKRMAASSRSSAPDTSLPAETAGERDYVNIAETAALLGVSRVSIWRWIRAGRLHAERLGHRTVRIRYTDLEQILVKIGPAGSRSWLGRTHLVETTAAERADGADASGQSGSQTAASEHFVQFYEADEFLLDTVTDFIGGALRAGEAGIVVATGPHREGLAERLRGHGLDLAAAQTDGQYAALDAAETLARFMVEGVPDPARFAAVAGGLIARATAGGRRLRIFGEMVSLLAIEGNCRATVRLEELWNEQRRAQSFALLCAYPLASLSGAMYAEMVGEVCTEHTRVIPAESYTSLPSPDDRLRAIVGLQQKARWLASVIAERQRTGDCTE